MAGPIDLNKRCFCVVTGASRGIGRCFAVELAKKFSSGHMVLLARNGRDLEEVKETINVETKGRVSVTELAMDLMKIDENQLKAALNLVTSNEKPFELALCVHNVGTIGAIDRWAATESDPEKWSSYFQVNLFQVILLNNLFLSATNQVAQRLVINVTSLCAIEAMKSCAYYCTGKAAREMFFKVLALENPQVTVLNYSPGMVDTDMAADLRNKSADEDLKKYAQETHEKRALLTPLQTTQRMLKVVEEGKFKSGDHVDYHDQ